LKTLAIFISDTHSGALLGLLNPDTELQIDGEKKKVQLNPGQEYLWEIYCSSLQFLKTIDADKKIIFHLGDMTQGTKRPKELVSTRVADHILMATDVLDYAIKEISPHVIRIAKGTGSHVFEEGTSEILVSELLKAKHPNLNIDVTYHGLATVDGYKIDYAHHGAGIGSRLWLHGNELRFYLRDRMLGEIVGGNTPADLYIRGHMHSYRREFLEIGKYTSQIISMPSMALMDDYAHQATRSVSSVTNGIIALEIIDGLLYNTHVLTNTLDFRTSETL